MGYIYIDSNYISGFASGACVGRVDEKGYVYNSENRLTGFASGACIGCGDDKGFVYRGEHRGDGFVSDRCVAKVDEKGYVYNDYNRMEGFASGKCIGKIDPDGYVYSGPNYLGGFASGACVGKVDTDSTLYIAGAALLTLILPNLSKTANKSDEETKQAEKKPNVVKGLAKGAAAAVGTTASVGAATVEATTATVGGVVVDTVGALGAVASFVLTLLMFAIPLGMLFLGVYLPYDIVFGNDSWGFAEYSQLFLIVYGLSAVMIILSLIKQIKTGEPELAFIYIYGFSALILMVGAFREGHPFLAILSIFPALILFAFPAIIWGLITFITNLFVKLAEKKGRGPSASEKTASVLATVYHIVGIILLIASGVIGYMIAEV